MTSAPAAHDPEPSRYFYPDDVQLLMQSLLGMLANLDFEHQRDLERLGRSTMRAGLKRDIAAKLKSRHARRAPYVEHLRTLHTRWAAANRPDREPESSLARCA